MVNRDPGRDAQLPGGQGVQIGLTLPRALNFHGVMAGPAIRGFPADWLSKTWMPGIADKFTQSAQMQTATAGHDDIVEGGLPSSAQVSISRKRPSP